MRALNLLLWVENMPEHGFRQSRWYLVARTLPCISKWPIVYKVSSCSNFIGKKRLLFLKGKKHCWLPFKFYFCSEECLSDTTLDHLVQHWIERLWNSREGKMRFRSTTEPCGFYLPFKLQNITTKTLLFFKAQNRLSYRCCLECKPRRTEMD